MTVYVDTSAMAKLLVREEESQALAEFLDGLVPEDRPVSSCLLETELRRLAVREELGQSAVSALLARVSLAVPDRALFHEAGVLSGRGLRSLDALHLATAIRFEDPVVVGYDARMLAAARDLGMETDSPSVSDTPTESAGG